MTRLLTVSAAAVTTTALATLIAGMIMSPTGAERVQMAVVFALLAIVAVLITATLGLWARTSLARRAVVMAIAAPLFITLALAVGAVTMFTSDHDQTFVLILIGFAGALAATVAYALTRPLTDALNTMRELTERVELFELQPAKLDRQDEAGNLATALDDLAARLNEAQVGRDKAEAERTLLITSLTHDIRTPLTAARAALEAIQDGMSPDPDRYLASIHYDLDAVTKMVDDLFLLGRLEASLTQSQSRPRTLDHADTAIDLSEVVTNASTALAPLAACRNVKIELEVDQPVHTCGVKGEVVRIVNNLLDNAIRHSSPNQQVTVSTSDDADIVTIRVRDQGPGFAAEFIPKAFEPFERAEVARDRLRGGAGLGLAVAKALVVAHHGDIHIEPGPGGQVIVNLPKLHISATTTPGTARRRYPPPERPARPDPWAAREAIRAS